MTYNMTRVLYTLRPTVGRKLLIELEGAGQMTIQEVENAATQLVEGDKKIIRIGGDFGNGATKLVANKEDLQRLGIRAQAQVTIPSAIGARHAGSQELYKRHRVAYGDVAGLKEQSKLRDFYILQEGMIEYLVGSAAQAYALDANTARGAQSRYFDGWTRRLMLVALHAMFPVLPDDVEIHLMTGVPASFWSSEMVEKIRTSLGGRHAVTINNETRTFNVAFVDVAVEGESALRTLSLADQVVFCLDVGAYTAAYGVFKITENEILNSPAHAGVEYLGIQEMLDVLDNALVSSKFRPLTILERQELLVALRDKQAYYIIVNNQRVRVDDAAQKVFSQLLADLMRIIGKKIDLRKVQKAVLVGGGAYFLIDALNQIAPIAFESFDQSEFLNALAYLSMLGGDVKRAAKKRKK